ncbi:MAG TPA: hypothetical protein VGJ82_20595 [Thermoanaerobaculia bacterium]|jgi:hypothetical protein
MKWRLAVVALFCTATAFSVHASCTEYTEYYYVTVDWSDGSQTGHWQTGDTYEVCDDGGSGGYYSGGGGTGTSGSQLSSLKNMYQTTCGDALTDGDFLDETAYNQSGMQNYFSWSDYHYESYNYVMMDQSMVGIVASVADCMDNNLPSMGQPNEGGGYRTPGSNSSTPCGDHVYGDAIDLTIKALTQTGYNGNYDCHLWNALAQCAHDAGAWVEPIDQILADGFPHFHFAWKNGQTNTDYGDACQSMTP